MSPIAMPDPSPSENDCRIGVPCCRPTATKATNRFTSHPDRSQVCDRRGDEQDSEPADVADVFGGEDLASDDAPQHPPEDIEDGHGSHTRAQHPEDEGPSHELQRAGGVSRLRDGRHALGLPDRDILAGGALCFRVGPQLQGPDAEASEPLVPGPMGYAPKVNVARRTEVSARDIDPDALAAAGQKGLREGDQHDCHQKRAPGGDFRDEAADGEYSGKQPHSQ